MREFCGERGGDPAMKALIGARECPGFGGGRKQLFWKLRERGGKEVRRMEHVAVLQRRGGIASCVRGGEGRKNLGVD